MGLRRELVLTMRQGDVFMHVLVLMTSFIHFILLVCDIDTHGVAQFVQNVTNLYYWCIQFLTVV